MRRFFIVLAALLITSSSYAAFSIVQTYLPSARTQVNFSTYGGVCDGVTDDTAAFLAFKAAWQGTTPVQLNLPVGACTFLATGGGGNPGFYTFRGVQDLVVNGQGAGSTSIKATGATLFLGANGQYQDNQHSVRTDTANAGDSCVIIKTQPAVTVSAAINNQPVSANFTASISGTTMTVTAVSAGSIPTGAFINAGVQSFTKIVSQSTGSAGSTGTYIVSISQTAPSQPMTTTPVTFTATVDAAGVMTVTAISDGSLAVGMWVYRQLGSISKPTSILSQLTGSAGSTGTYQLSNAPVSALPTSSDFIGNGQPRITLNSTTGLTTGDTLFLTGLAGIGVFPQRVNGLQWIKVINGTQIDLFQQDFNGSYTSGGTGGGDRTSLFPIGSKVLMTGWSNQSYWATPTSYPSNPHWFEYKTVASANSGTHQVCFDTPLIDTYKDTWPQMNTGSQFEVDPGGPATLYVLPTDWEMTLVVQNLTLDNPTQTYAQGRNTTYRNVTMTGSGCGIPTQNETFTWDNVTGTNCTIETDKIVKTWNLSNSTLKRIHLQSSSIETVNINNVTMDQMYGTPKRFVADNLTTTCASCTPGSLTENSFQVGVATYGVTDEVVITNSTILGPSGSTRGNGFEYSVPFPEVNNPNHSWSMSSGIITIPNGLSWSGAQGESELQVKTIVPGHYVFWQTNIVGRALKVIDVTQDVNNIYVQTSEASGFPTGTWTAPTSGIIKLIPHPAPKFTITNVSGVTSATDFNGCPPQDPIFSCANYTRTGGASGTTLAIGPRMWGELISFTFTNNVPYTNTGSLSWTVPQFNTFPYLTTANAVTNVNFVINTKLPSSGGGGTRTFTSSGVTGNQVGDSFPSAFPSGAVVGGALSLSQFSANTPSDSPQVTVTLRTDQHLP